MHICLICVEIFAWGKYGGFGRATRVIGQELLKKGIQVTAIIPRRQKQAPVENLDGIRVLSFKITDLKEMIRIFRECDADIYHSQEPSFGTFLAQIFHPEKKHIVTFRDTRLFKDWIIEFQLPSLNKLQVFLNWLYEDNFLVHYAVCKADRLFIASNLLGIKAQKKYNLKNQPGFLPTPVSIPPTIQKDQNPTVCYVSRWDRRKRPELFIRLAKSFPKVHFIMVGASRDQKFDQFVRSQASNFPNIEMVGFINQFENDRLSNIMSRSWIYINTAAREGLPNSFIEACAHRCAILSSLNSDGFSSSFGYYAVHDDFVKGLEYLLENNRWKELGEKGYIYVREHFALANALQQHLDIYRDIIANH